MSTAGSCLLQQRVRLKLEEAASCRAIDNCGINELADVVRQGRLCVPPAVGAHVL